MTTITIHCNTIKLSIICPIGTSVLTLHVAANLETKCYCCHLHSMHGLLHAATFAYNLMRQCYGFVL